MTEHVLRMLLNCSPMTGSIIVSELKLPPVQVVVMLRHLLDCCHLIERNGFYRNNNISMCKE